LASWDGFALPALKAGLVVIATLEGGLGNQLFQYAVGRAVAQRTGSRLFLDCSFYRKKQCRTYQLGSLHVKGTRLPTSVARLFNGIEGNSTCKRWIKNQLGKNLARLQDRGRGYDSRIASLPGHCRLTGPWQCEKYFASIRESLLSELQPRESIIHHLQPVLQRVQSTNAVAVHIRRGDLVTNDYYRERIGTLPADYYASAFSQVTADHPDAEFFVFTEDADWAQKHLRSTRPLTIVSAVLTRTPVEDLFVMSQCRHFIIANSTFSWWGAWLSQCPDKTVIAPSRFFRVPRPWEDQMVPPSWRRIETELCASA
jgi:hypothetical protein